MAEASSKNGETKKAKFSKVAPKPWREFGSGSWRKSKSVCCRSCIDWKAQFRPSCSSLVVQLAQPQEHTLRTFGDVGIRLTGVTSSLGALAGRFKAEGANPCCKGWSEGWGGVKRKVQRTEQSGTTADAYVPRLPPNRGAKSTATSEASRTSNRGGQRRRCHPVFAPSAVDGADLQPRIGDNNDLQPRILIDTGPATRLLAILLGRCLVAGNRPAHGLPQSFGLVAVAARLQAAFPSHGWLHCGFQHGHLPRSHAAGSRSPRFPLGSKSYAGIPGGPARLHGHIVGRCRRHASGWPDGGMGTW